MQSWEPPYPQWVCSYQNNKVACLCIIEIREHLLVAEVRAMAPHHIHQVQVVLLHVLRVIQKVLFVATAMAVASVQAVTEKASVQTTPSERVLTPRKSVVFAGATEYATYVGEVVIRINRLTIKEL